MIPYARVVKLLKEVDWRVPPSASSTGEPVPFKQQFGSASTALIIVTALYLALPNVIFAAVWLRWNWAVPVTAVLVVALGWLARDLTAARGTVPPVRRGPRFRPRDFVLVALATLLLASLSGIGGWGYQDPDWHKHNAIFRDLIAQPWPVVYDLTNGPTPLVYYVAYFLPAALVGKLAGWTAANLALFVWSVAGLFLALMWFVRLSYLGTLRTLLLFSAFAGLDVLGQLIVALVLEAVQPELLWQLASNHVEHWAILWHYNGNITLLFWVPNQALAGWLGTALVLAAWRSRQPQPTLFYAALTALWSPFVTLGLALYVAGAALLPGPSLRTRARSTASVPNLAGLLYLVLIGLFYAAKLNVSTADGSLPLPAGFSLSYFRDYGPWPLGLGILALFYVLEFGLYAVLLYTGRRAWDVPTWALFALTSAWLLLLPQFIVGEWNDLVMRASIPALFVLALLVSRALGQASLPGTRRLMLVLLLIIGAGTQVVELRRHLVGIADHGAVYHLPAISDVPVLWALPGDTTARFLAQYVGDINALFFRQFASEAPAVQAQPSQTN